MRSNTSQKSEPFQQFSESAQGKKANLGPKDEKNVCLMLKKPKDAQLSPGFLVVDR